MTVLVCAVMEGVQVEHQRSTAIRFVGSLLLVGVLIARLTVGQSVMAQEPTEAESARAEARQELSAIIADLPADVQVSREVDDHGFEVVAIVIPRDHPQHAELMDRLRQRSQAG
jgi:hypothetical protein